MASRRDPIIVSGGGIGGLSSAIALARRGVASRVLERRAAFSEDGAGIQIGPNGVAVLDHLGIKSDLLAAAAAPQALRVFDGTNARELARMPLGAWIAARHGAPYWTLHRRDLHAALLTAAQREPLIAIETGAAVARVFEAPDRLTVEASDKRTWDGPALVVAEGLWSRTRQHVAGAAAFPHPVGRCAARTVIPAARVPHDLRRMEVGLWLAPGAHVVHYPVRGGSEWALVLVVPEDDGREGWSLSVDESWVARHAASFPPLLRELLAGGEGWRKWSLQAMAGPLPLAGGRVALLGDAAHPVMPFLAQGAVLALEDAVTLASALAARMDDVPAALASYARGRRDRVARVQAASARNGRIYHLAGAAAAARNLALRAISGERFMAGFDWLYGWRA